MTTLIVNLIDINWESFCSWLLFDKKMSGKKSAITTIYYRFRVLQKHFKDKTFIREEFVNYLAELKGRDISNSTCNKFISLAKNLAKYLKVTGFEDLTYFKEPRKKNVSPLTWKEMLDMASVQIEYHGGSGGMDRSSRNHLYYCLIKLLSETGCRISEALSLKWDDLKADRVIFNDTKNGDDRVVAIRSELFNCLSSLPRRDPRVFGIDDLPTIRNDLKRRAETLHINKDIYPHIFRHSFISNMLEDGCPIQVVQEIVGHRDINTTIRYNHQTLALMEQMMYTHCGLWRESQTFDMLKGRLRGMVEKLVDTRRFSLTQEDEGDSIVIRVKKPDHET